MGKIREGLWRCTSCQQENKGRYTVCESCGKPRGEDVKFYLPQDAPVVTDEKQLAEAKAGPDVTCDHCGGDNRITSTHCTQCGNELNNDDKSKGIIDNDDKSKGIIDNIKSEYMLDIAKTFKLLPGLSIFMIGGSVIWLIYFLLSPRMLLVEAINKSWERTIYTEDYKTVVEEAWNIPNGGRMISVRSKIYDYNHVLDHYETRSRQVPHTVQTGTTTRIVGHRDLGNGYFEDIEESVPIYETEYHTEIYQEPIYRDDPIYQSYYTYEIERWVDGIPIKTSGNDLEPKWGTIITTPIYKESSRSGVYSTIFKCVEDGGNIFYETSDQSEWEKYVIGKSYKLYRNRLGIVSKIEPHIR